MDQEKIPLADIRRFWETHPVAAAAIGAALGTPEYFAEFDLLREQVEPADFQKVFYEYERHAQEKVLDVGCGNGYILSRYARSKARVTGIDLTRQGVQLSSRRFELEQLPGVFVQGNAEKLPFAKAYFDVVVSMGVLHHTPRPENAIREIYRVLKPGGIFRVMLYHRDSVLYRFKIPLLRLFRYGFFGKTSERIVNEVDGKDNPLGRVYTKADMMDLLIGFDPVEVRAGSLEPSHFGKEALGRLVPRGIRNRLGRHGGWFLYARAVKPV